MAISNVKIVSIIGISSALNDVVKVCGESQVFHPDDAMSFYSKTKDFIPCTDRNEFSEPLKRLQKIVARAEKNLELTNIKDFDVTPKEIDDYIEYLYSKFEKMLDSRKNTIDKIEKYKKSLEQIKPFIGLKLDLCEISKCQYIKARFGRLPKESLPKLDSYKDNPFILFFPCTNTEEYCYGMYFTPEENKKEVDRLFAGLYFERIKISEKNGIPEEKIEEIENIIKEEETNLFKINQKIDSFWETQKEQCQRFYTKLKELETYSGIKKYVSKYKDNFILVGWIPEENEAEFSAELDKIYGVEYSIDRPDTSKKHLPPVKLKNNWFAKPFEQFVEMYGLPEYRQFDPTMFVAITYTIIYGAMFGDLGHGIVLTLAGYLLYKFKKFSLGPIMTRCGISACFFGVLFGSFFGDEHALDPLYKNVFSLNEKPIDVMASDKIMLIIGSAVGLGVLLIIIAIVFKIIMSIKLKDWENALFSPNGLSGLVFYVSLIVGGVLQVALSINVMTPLYIIFLLVVPIFLMFFKEPLGKLISKKKDWLPKNLGDYISQNIFEMFTVFLEYVVNTVSFLRVGAYVLVHSGLMMAVDIIAQMVPMAGVSLFIRIFGNLFVICLEGLLVGIQVVRLEFYEMFSRIFEGSGQPFKPVTSPRSLK